MQTRVAFFLLLFLWGLGESNQNLLIADSCYFRRADNAFGDKANIVLIQKMVQSYKDALKDTSVHEKASLGLLKSYYFMIRFASPNTKNQRKELIKTAKDFAHISHEHYPKNIEITKLYLILLSIWGAETNPLIAIKQGVAKKVRDLADSIQDYQALGRTHQLLPYIPLILPWPDKKLADKYLQLALKKDPKDPYNYFFLAELRFNQERYAEAENLIKKGLSLGVRTEYFLEDKRGRWELKELQKKVNYKKYNNFH